MFGRISKAFCLCAALSSVLVHAQSYNGTNSTSLAGALYKDPSASVDDRVADLLSRMTLEEKIGQLMQGSYIVS